MREIEIPNIDRSLVPGKILYEVIVGDQLYGIKKNAKTKIKGVYIADRRQFLLRTHPPIFTNAQGVDYYELGCFIDLMTAGDLQVLEMVFAPKNYHVLCEEIFNIHVLSKKLAFITKGYIENAMNFVKDSLKSVKMEMATFQEFYTEFRTKKSIDVNDYIYMMTPATNISYVKTFNEYLKSKNTREQSHYTNYISLPSKMADNIRYLYFMGGTEGVYGIVNQLTGELHQYEKDPKLKNVANKGIPVGIVCYDKERFEKESSNFSFRFDIVKDISKEKDSKWKLDVYQQSDIFYHSERLMHSIRILDQVIDFLDNRAGLRIVPSKDALHLYSMILNGDIPFKTLYFDVTEKIRIITSKERSFPIAKPLIIVPQSMEYPIRRREYYKQEMVSKFKAIEPTGSDLEDEERQSMADLDSQWND